MAQTWGCRITWQRGGKKFSNLFHFNSANALNSDAIKAEILPVVQALKNPMMMSVTLVSATIFDPTKRANGYDPSLVRTIGYGIGGGRADAGNPLEIKEVVVRMLANAATGKPGHMNLRMCCFDSEVTGGTDGQPYAAGAIAPVEQAVQDLNTAIQNGLDMRMYGKRRSGAVTDVKISAWTYGGVSYQSATRRKKKPLPTKQSSLISAGKDLLDNVARFNAGSQLVKAAAGALTGASLQTELGNALTAAESALPELAAAL